MYYHENSEIREANYFSGNIWASKTIRIFIEMYLELWDTRNKDLHGDNPADQNKM